tara:strand:+ start:2464 stop:2790 length:327 start_codon:yes stop_codon:yes gene_type:complete
MKFFESEVVQNELKRMQELYVDINRMGIILSIDQKIQQLVKLLELIDIQQTMFMRVTLSEDEHAKRILQQVREAAGLLGMKPENVNPLFYDQLKDQVNKMIKDLEQSK